VVARDPAEAERLLEACRPTIVQAWTLEDFAEVTTRRDEATLARGLHAFVKAQCSQCHLAAGHGVNLGPKLPESVKKLQGRELLAHILDPSKKIADQYRTVQFILEDGRVVSGVLAGETAAAWKIRPNLLTPDVIKLIPKATVEEQIASQVSPMPAGLLNVLTRQEVFDLLSFVAAGDDLPAGLAADHGSPGAN